MTRSSLLNLSVGVIKEVYVELVPEFEKSSGHKFVTTWTGSANIKKKIAAGEVYDLVIIGGPEIDAFIQTQSRNGFRVFAGPVTIIQGRLPGLRVASILLVYWVGTGDVMPNTTIQAEPAPLSIDLARTGLIIIDMQRDFLEPGGFGAALGNDVSLLRTTVEPIRTVLDAARAAGMLVIHTREGHSPDMNDAPPTKVERGAPGKRIGDPGPMGRILIQGEPGHDIISQLYPIAGELVIDKPGKGAFYGTNLGSILVNRGIENLLVCGVTTEVCVNTTVREANDRGIRCIVLSDCCGSYFPEFHEAGLKMIKAQGGIFGWVSSSQAAVSTILKEA